MSGYLKAWLAADARAARAHVGERQRRQTSGGLKIELYLDGQDRLHVLLARQGKAPPSLQEAATVVNCLPAWAKPEGAPAWQSFPNGAWKCLSAVWPLPTVQLSLTESAP